VATMWMGGAVTRRRAGFAPIAGGSIEADAGGADGGDEGGEGSDGASVWPGPSASVRDAEVVFVGVLFAAACIFFGIFPTPLFHLSAHAAHAITGLF
jgi:hypothetical protein